MTMPGKEGPPIAASERRAILNLGKWNARGEIEGLRNAITPEAIRKYWQARLGFDGQRAGLKITVPEFPFTQEELAKPMKSIRGKEIAGRILYLPEELMGKAGLIRLGKMYPWLIGEKSEGSYTLEEDTPVTNVYDEFGYTRVEATIPAPNRNTTEEELMIFARKEGYGMQREVAYILNSLMSFDFTNKFLDEGGRTWSRLGGSKGENGVIAACFYPDGHLRVLLSIDPRQHNDQFGGRFEQAIKA